MKWISAIVLLLASSTSFAQLALNDGTVDVYHEELRAEGRLEGCSLVFSSLKRDTAYLGGQQVLVNGSFAIRTLDRPDLFLTGKLGTKRINKDGTPAGAWERPVHFYFSTRTGSTATSNIQDAETAGYRLAVVRATDEPVMRFLKELSQTGEFTVGFNRKAGGQDVLSQIKLDVSLKQDASGTGVISTDPTTRPKFADCLSRVLDDLAKRLGGR
jgi:hypothetical protein